MYDATSKTFESIKNKTIFKLNDMDL